MRLDLNGKVSRFTAFVGVDDEARNRASIEFYVLGDKKILWQSGVMKKGEVPKKVDVDLTRIKTLGLLVSNAGDGNNWDHADWCDAKLNVDVSVRSSDLTKSSLPEPGKAKILTPPSSDKPQINGAKVFGVRPGHPFLFSIVATGKRPMSFSATGLPQGLTLDESQEKSRAQSLVPENTKSCLGRRMRWGARSACSRLWSDPTFVSHRRWVGIVGIAGRAQSTIKKSEQLLMHSSIPT
jgi:hypothetical protein